MKNTTTEIWTTSELIAAQPQAVVSRTLVQNKSGTVTLFAFDGGQGLSEHTAPYDALVHLIEGEMEITVAGAPFRLSAGQMILMPGGQPHALHAHSPCKMLLTMIRA
ncbi:MAG: cupin domain-containing protein [Chloroflexota bacterium]|jgi:quercetin dioxygenase-like cupin family protein